ncbi:hypothetical protein HER32_12245 [Hymenobacter sp. BT18]|uniref:hypothetical protein n=1 Tax=Hymenobacter sp. BT18 TaxID=2835648 RepID=UPI00143E1F79|nr:hypothetical protein [Hymenobacter sp. BT18]QIX61911.1 hypothetical protein HER32_12245 [Hymenobacter sp. BT18]
MKQRILILAAVLFVPALGMAQNVGIGTTTPAERLEVSGNIQIPAANDFKYDGERVGYVSVPAIAFTYAPFGSTTAYLTGTTTGTYRYVAGGSYGNSAHLFAPVYLPNGARITRYTVYVYDNDASYELYGNLYRINLATNVITNIGSTSLTNGTPLNTTILADVSSVVDNAVYAYYVRFNTVENASSLRLLGARITYAVMKVE